MLHHFVSLYGLQRDETYPQLCTPTHVEVFYVVTSIDLLKDDLKNENNQYIRFPISHLLPIQYGRLSQSEAQFALTEQIIS